MSTGASKSNIFTFGLAQKVTYEAELLFPFVFDFPQEPPCAFSIYPTAAVRLNLEGLGAGVISKPVDLVGYRLALSAWAGEFLSRYA